ncbi:MAG: hypothetical protein WCK98_01745 [bacterium]
MIVEASEFLNNLKKYFSLAKTTQLFIQYEGEIFEIKPVKPDLKEELMAKLSK